MRPPVPRAWPPWKSWSPKRSVSGPQRRVKAAELSIVPDELFSRPDGPLRESICVDAACSGNPGRMEYQGVDTVTGARIFHLGPVERGTNNIGEFLAIVHALAFMKQRGLKMPVYTDSRTALSWISKKKANTKLAATAKTSKLFDLIKRAEKWLETNPGPYNIRKWDTERWGEIPADFGRK